MSNPQVSTFSFSQELEEIALRLDQIAGLEHHRLGFVEDREIQQAGSGRGLAVLDPHGAESNAGPEGGMQWKNGPGGPEPTAQTGAFGSE